jgi:hypothetical protein
VTHHLTSEIDIFCWCLVSRMWEKNHPKVTIMFFRRFDKFQICILTFLKGVERDRADHPQNRQKQQTHDCVQTSVLPLVGSSLRYPRKNTGKEGGLSSKAGYGNTNQKAPEERMRKNTYRYTDPYTHEYMSEYTGSVFTHINMHTKWTVLTINTTVLVLSIDGINAPLNGIGYRESWGCSLC